VDTDERRKGLGGVRIERKKPRKRPRFPSETKRIKATWDISPELRDRVKAKAKELGVGQYRLIEKLLVDGLDRIDAGELDFKRVPISVKYDLE
jgi:hypothetical protein